jgi:hypothetical protein
MRVWSWKTWLLIAVALWVLGWVLKHILPVYSGPPLISDKDLFFYFCCGVLMLLWQIRSDLKEIREKLENWPK